MTKEEIKGKWKGKYCTSCGQELSKVFRYTYYDSQTGEPINSFNMECTKTKSFLFWNIRTCSDDY